MSTGTYGASQASDTRVVGQRVAATLVDTLLLAPVFVAMNATVALAERLDGSRVEEIVNILTNLQIVDGVYVSVLLVTTLAMVIVWFAYYVVMEGRYGQTLGKMALGIRVVREDGGPIGAGAAALRTLMQFVDGIGFWLVAFVVALVSKKNRRLGDMVAKTLVVRA